MNRYRILYLWLLAMAAAYYVIDTRYLSWLLLTLLLLLVPLEVLLSLPGLFTLRLRLTADQETLRQGGVLTARVEISSRFPVHGVRLRLHCQNLLTGEEADKKGCFPSRGAPCAELPCLWEHCGTVRCRVTSARLVDLMGLFSFRVALPQPVEVLVSPQALPFQGDVALLLPGAAQAGASVAAGKGGEERSAVREFQDGDQLRDVHWKLSSKLQKLMVREAEQSPQPSVVLAFCLSGEPEQADQTLARVTGLSQELLARQCAHSLQWYDAAQAELPMHLVEDQASFLAAMREACSHPMEETEQRVEAYREQLNAPEADLLFLIHPDGITVLGEEEGGSR